MSSPNTPKLPLNKELFEEKVADLPFLDDYPQLNQWTQALFASMINATKEANGLANPEDHQYYLNFVQYEQRVRDMGKRVLSLIQKSLDFALVNNNARLLSYEDSTEVAENFESVVEVLDDLIDDVVRRETVFFVFFFRSFSF